MTTLLAIDPGTTESAWCLIDTATRRPIQFGKDINLAVLTGVTRPLYDHLAIEMVSSYGMPVGAEVFETCVWIGRFYQASLDANLSRHITRDLVTRGPIKLHHCHSSRANDANITQALIDRFAPGVRNHGKGLKSEPGWFYGFKADVWQAYALAVMMADTLETSSSSPVAAVGE